MTAPVLTTIVKETTTVILRRKPGDSNARRKTEYTVSELKLSPTIGLGHSVKGFKGFR